MSFRPFAFALLLALVLPVHAQTPTTTPQEPATKLERANNSLSGAPKEFLECDVASRSAIGGGEFSMTAVGIRPSGVTAFTAKGVRIFLNYQDQYTNVFRSKYYYIDAEELPSLIANLEDIKAKGTNKEREAPKDVAGASLKMAIGKTISVHSIGGFGVFYNANQGTYRILEYGNTFNPDLKAITRIITNLKDAKLALEQM